MNEISVIVKQEPGKVTWNFEDIKKRLEADLKTYRSTIYTDDTIKDAKGDVAELRKLAAAIEERRKEVKEKCLEPYSVIEAQAKELVSLIDKPIQAINDQVKDYEKRRKEKARAEITAYWLQKCVVLPEDIREKAKQSIYDTRWENATATKKSWREGIDNGIQKIVDEIATIQSFNSEFEEDALEVYKADLSLQRAIQKMNELKAQKERILEMERKRQEREAEQERQEQERLDRVAEGTAVTSPILNGKPADRDSADVPHMSQGREIRQNFQNVTQTETRAYTDGAIKQIRILGTKQQIGKILDYIRFTGATYEEV